MPANSKNLSFNDTDLWVYPSSGQYEEGMQTTYLGSTIVDIVEERGSRTLVIKGAAVIKEETVRKTGAFSGPIRANYLVPALALGKETPTRYYSTKDVWKGKGKRVLNPNVLSKIFFGTYDFNMCFMLNLYVFLKKNPEFEGMRLYEIVHLTIQDRVKKCKRVSREAEHQADKTEWELVPFDAEKDGYKLGELYTVASTGSFGV